MSRGFHKCKEGDLKHTDTERDTHGERDTHRETRTETHRERETHIQIHTDTHTHARTPHARNASQFRLCYRAGSRLSACHSLCIELLLCCAVLCAVCRATAAVLCCALCCAVLCRALHHCCCAVLCIAPLLLCCAVCCAVPPFARTDASPPAPSPPPPVDIVAVSRPPLSLLFACSAPFVLFPLFPLSYSPLLSFSAIAFETDVLCASRVREWTCVCCATSAVML